MRPMKAVLALTLLLGLMVMLAACEESKRAPQPMGSGTALMMVDYQRDFLQADGRMPIAQDQTAAVIKAANDLIAAARAHLIPVIFIKDEFTPWVLIGNMSIVGPRPIIESERTLYGRDLPCYDLFCPGITGLWQVSGRSDVDYARRVLCDRKYASQWSCFLDLVILARTIPVVISMRGAY